MNSKDPPKCGCLVQDPPKCGGLVQGSRIDIGVRVRTRRWQMKVESTMVMADESGDAPHVL